MKKALRDGLENILPSPFLGHTNEDTVPPTVTLGITACELMDICAGIAAVLRPGADRTIPILAGPIPSMRMFLSPDSLLTRTS
eukprot:12933697-Prorocentrum_lima.AAC.1